LRRRQDGSTVAAPSPPIPAPTAAALPATVAPAAPVLATPSEEVVILPTPGPREAADATVGRPRSAGSEPARPTPRVRAAPVPAASAPAEASASGSDARPAEPAKTEHVDAVYATRHRVRFTSSPEQARLTIDGRSVGIADDWDNRGGGREFVFETPGAHDVRMELPGYKTMRLRIDVSPQAEKDSVSIDEELDRNQRTPYEKLPSVYDRTTGPVEFVVEPSEATVAEGGKVLGRASAFGPGSALTLRGPAVHDLVLSAPGYQPKLVRILVAGNAERDRAQVNEKLKRE
ncbi:MAG: hypothetical protein ABI968_11680, partial [Acidobacteriota bacterium]